MCGIDQLFQIFGRAIATTGGKETSYLISEACVVCVLHNSHQLNRVVTQIFDSGQHILSEFLVRADTLFWSGNADMSLIDYSCSWLRRTLMFENICLGLRGVPENGVVVG